MKYHLKLVDDSYSAPVDSSGSIYGLPDKLRARAAAQPKQDEAMVQAERARVIAELMSSSGDSEARAKRLRAELQEVEVGMFEPDANWETASAALLEMAMADRDNSFASTSRGLYTWYRQTGDFTVPAMSLVCWRLTYNRIAFDPQVFAVSISDHDHAKIKAMKPFQIAQVMPCLDDAQQLLVLRIRGLAPFRT